MFNKKIIKVLPKLPKAPGVYFFYGQGNELLYIGKATDLRSRVSSYFKNVSPGYQRLIETFIDQVADIKWQTTDSTLEALILESNLINRLQPKFNVEARDDKTFLGIYITDDDYPRVFSARITNKKLPTGEFFGPYASATKAKQAIKILRRIFPWCNQSTSYQEARRPCLYYHLKLCPGPCAKAISQSDYQQIIKNLKLFLKGKKKELIRDLKKQMKEAAVENNFEQAARLRDELKALEHIHDIALQLNEDIRQQVRRQPWRLRIEGFDISNISGQWAVGSMVTFVDGKPAKDSYRRFKIKTVEGVDDVRMMREVIARRLAHAGDKSEIQNPKFKTNSKNYWPLPDLVVIDGGQGHYNAIQRTLDQNRASIDIIAIAKGYKRKNADLFGQAAVLKKYQALLPVLIQVRDEAHRFAIQYHRQLRSNQVAI